MSFWLPFWLCVSGSATATTIDRYSLGLDLLGLGKPFQSRPQGSHALLLTLSALFLKAASDLSQSSGAIPSGRILQAIRFPKDGTYPHIFV